MALFELKKHYYLESSRRLTKLPDSHPCASVHGHSFQVTLVFRGPTNELDWVIDYGDIDKLAKEVLDPLDHSNLNDFLDNPTTEKLCKLIFEEMGKRTPMIHRVEIAETRDTLCSYPA